MANKAFPPQLNFVHFHQLLNSLSALQDINFNSYIILSSFGDIIHYLTSSLCIFLCMSRCLMPQCFLCILLSLFERFFLLWHHSLYSFSPWRTVLSSPCFLETSLTLTELIMPLYFFRTLYKYCICTILYLRLSYIIIICHIFFILTLSWGQQSC